LHYTKKEFKNLLKQPYFISICLVINSVDYATLINHINNRKIFILAFGSF